MLQKVARFIEKNERFFSLPMLFVLVVVAMSTAVIQPRFIELMELKTLDIRFEVRGPIEADKRVVIVAIDDDSLTKIGRWPWPRDKISTIIERVLGDYGASSIGFDIVFSESQVNPLTESLRLLSDADRSHEVVSQWLTRNSESGDLDHQFEKLLATYHDRIAMGYFFYPEGGDIPLMAVNNLKDDSRHLGGSAMTAEVLGKGNDTVFARIGAIEGNLYRFTDAVDASGFFNFFPDMDGMVRRVPLVAELDGYYYPNLDLQTLRIALGWPDLSVQISELGVEAIILGDHVIPTGHDGRLLLNHYGPGKTFSHISAADVLDGMVNPAVLKDAVVLIGVTAAGVYDYRPSPFDTVFPGVEAHAATIANVLNNMELQRPLSVELSELLAILLLSALSGWLVMRWGVAMQIATVIVVPIAILMTSQWLFNTYNFWFKETYIIIGVLITTLPTIIVKYLVESRKRAFIHDAFSHYLAPAIVQQLSQDPDKLNLGGEVRNISAFFSDIASFSTFAERLNAEELVHFLNIYLSAMSDIILEYGGTIDKYEGDAIIAFFGAPIDFEDHAWRCVMSAVKQQELLQQLRLDWKKEGYPDVHIRIGVNSGPIVVGNMGTAERMDYTMMGDHVNLASRLEGVCKQYRVPTLISRDTHIQVREKISSRFVDRVQVVGREAAVDIYQPLGVRGEVPEFTIDLARWYEKGWVAMQGRDFDEAAKIFSRLHEEFPEDGPCEVMLERVRNFMKESPPADWDCVHTLINK